MRTPEQIENLRKVLGSMIGIFAKFMTDDQVNDWANRIQNEVDLIKSYWSIKVMLDSNINSDWDHIQCEPVKPYATLKEVFNSSKHLMQKYKTIVSIRICQIDPVTNIENKSECYIL